MRCWGEVGGSENRQSTGTDAILRPGSGARARGAKNGDHLLRGSFFAATGLLAGAVPFAGDALFAGDAPFAGDAFPDDGRSAGATVLK